MEPMTTRSSRSAPAAMAYSIAGGTGASTVAVPLATLIQAGETFGHGVSVASDSGAFEVLGQPQDKLPRWAAAHRSPIGADCTGN